MQDVQDLGNGYFDGSSDGKMRNWSGIVRIPYAVVNETRLLDIMLDLIRSVKAPSSNREEPSMKLGFLPDLIGFGIDTIIFLYCSSRTVIQCRGTTITEEIKSLEQACDSRGNPFLPHQRQSTARVMTSSYAIKSKI